MKVEMTRQVCASSLRAAFAIIIDGATSAQFSIVGLAPASVFAGHLL
ncbi:hypothetical protein JHU04_004056 [Brenneria sp. 4F2]|nr:hypothetical protein [Brenneria bubanii]